MSDLKAFLSENAINESNIKYVASKRFVGDDGKPIEWEICCITSSEDEALRRECTKRVPVAGRKGAYTPETDYNKYIGKLAAKCTVYPNLNDKVLQDSYKVMGDDTLLKAMLKPGEYADFISKIQEVNGFDVTMEERVDEAKN